MASTHTNITSHCGESNLVLNLLLLQNVVCDDCIKFLTDAQTEAKANSSFVDALIQRIEDQCELLGPGMSDMVSVLQGAETLQWSLYF